MVSPPTQSEVNVPRLVCLGHRSTLGLLLWCSSRAIARGLFGSVCGRGGAGLPALLLLLQLLILASSPSASMQVGPQAAVQPSSSRRPVSRPWQGHRRQPWCGVERGERGVTGRWGDRRAESRRSLPSSAGDAASPGGDTVRGHLCCQHLTAPCYAQLHGCYMPMPMYEAQRRR